MYVSATRILHSQERDHTWAEIFPNVFKPSSTTIEMDPSSLAEIITLLLWFHVTAFTRVLWGDSVSLIWHVCSTVETEAITRPVLPPAMDAHSFSLFPPDDRFMFVFFSSFWREREYNSLLGKNFQCQLVNCKAHTTRWEASDYSWSDTLGEPSPTLFLIYLLETVCCVLVMKWFSLVISGLCLNDRFDNIYMRWLDRGKRMRDTYRMDM